MAAAFVDERWGIERDEAHQVADAVKRVAEHYGPTGLDPKKVAWAKLMIVLGKVYGTRAYVIMSDKPAKQPKPVQVAGPVAVPSRQKTDAKLASEKPTLTNPSQLDNSEVVENDGEAAIM